MRSPNMLKSHDMELSPNRFTLDGQQISPVKKLPAEENERI